MKFAYIDESGDQDQGDVFVMAGLLIDAYRLRKYTAEFDTALTTFLSNHPSAPKELKTCLLYTSPSPRDDTGSRMPSSA